MNLKKQAQLISEGIYNEIIDHKKLILWVDQIINNTEKAEDWMIDLSLSKKNEITKIEEILGKQFGHCFEGSFTEYLALLAAKVELKQIPAFECYSSLTSGKDFLDINPNDTDSIAARKLIEEMENQVENNEFNDESIDNSINIIKKLLSFAKAKHPDVFEFIINFA